MRSQVPSKSTVHTWVRPLLLLGALASGCAGTTPGGNAVVIGSASAEPTPDDLLHAQLQAALAESAQMRASRRTALWMLQNRPTGRTESTEVRGTLPPIEIQRVVRANFGPFRRCYGNGLSKNPKLSGRVAVKFIIDREGKVSNVGDGGSDLADEEVVACVVKAFYTLVFPKPDGGIVTVVYPMMFSPGDSPSSASATASASASAPPSPPRPVAVAKGHSTAPIVVIDDSSIRIDGVEVGNVKAIVDLGKMQKIDALFDTLKARREKWEAEHPGQEPDGIAGLRAESRTSQVVFKSVFQTMAFAGYPYIHVQNASDPATIVELGAQVPGPPSSNAGIQPTPELHVAFSTADDVAFVWKLGAVVLSEARVAKENFFGANICQNSSANGQQRKADDQQSLLVLHVDDRAKLDDVIRVARAAEECTRDVQDAGGRIRKRPVFWNVFSVR